MKSMNAGDKAFFYHSNCKEPGIVGTMEIVKEFSEDSTSATAAYSFFFVVLFHCSVLKLFSSLCNILVCC